MDSKLRRCFFDLNSVNVGIRVRDVPKPSLRWVLLIEVRGEPEVLDEYVTGGIVVDLEIHLDWSDLLPDLVTVHLILEGNRRI